MPQLDNYFYLSNYYFFPFNNNSSLDEQELSYIDDRIRLQQFLAIDEDFASNGLSPLLPPDVEILSIG